MFSCCPTQAASEIRPDRWVVCESHSPCHDASEIREIKNMHSSAMKRASQATIHAWISKNIFNGGAWLFVGEVGDTVKIALNGKVIFDPNKKNGDQIYFRYLSVFAFIPPDLVTENNDLSFEVTDLNQTIFGLRSTLSIGPFPEILALATFDFLMRTGSNFLSSFTLLFLSLGALIALYFLRDLRLFFLFLYGIISSAYLVSFSEVPRSFYNPILLSGPVHFTLRLMQDLSLCLLLLSVFRRTKKKQIGASIYIGYGTAFCALWFSYFKNHDYPTVEYVMFYCAPLVALPSLFALFLCHNLPDLIERRWSRRFFSILFILQVNDLLVFWQLISGYFFVKWYIPLVFIYILFLLLRRSSIENRERQIFLRLGAEHRQFAHDIRPAITALKVGISKIVFASEDISNFLHDALNRVEIISKTALSVSGGNEPKTIASFLEVLEKLCGFYEKNYLCEIKVSENIRNKNLNLAIDTNTLSRVIQNIFQNSQEACPGCEIQMHIKSTSRLLRLEITDSGPGFPKDVLAGIGQRYLTRKVGGTGFGLPYCIETIHQANGRVDVRNTRKGGACIKIELPFLDQGDRFFCRHLTAYRNRVLQ